MNAKTLGLTLLAGTASAMLLWGCQTTRPSPIDEPSVQEGLVRVPNKTVDAVYRRPDASLAGYNKLLLRPVEVQFAKNWDPASSGSALYQMNEPDREKIKRELADVFAAVVKRDLERQGGYPLVNEPGSDVLEARAAVVNLYINAPDAPTAGRTKVYTTEAGEMTLILQLHDSVTGQLLARVYDRRVGRDSGYWTWTNSVTNTAEAERIISIWATGLRKALDAAHAKS
ncbi:MAG TPA: DUF3313 family protein [Steroidobacter sp.]|jgi:hypothetical protein|nr:DUF3313 family protein [Steroidobacter sp.]